MEHLSDFISTATLRGNIMGIMQQACLAFIICCHTVLGQSKELRNSTVTAFKPGNVITRWATGLNPEIFFFSSSPLLSTISHSEYRQLKDEKVCARKYKINNREIGVMYDYPQTRQRN